MPQQLSNQQIFEQFESLFTESCPHCHTTKTLERAYEDDKIAVREDFANYLDGLHRDKQISDDQVNRLDVSDWINNSWPKFEVCDDCGEYKETNKKVLVYIDNQIIHRSEICDDCINKKDFS